MRKGVEDMRESDIEKLLVDGVEALGGFAEKFVSPGHRNVPDRICTYPGGVTHWVECKAPGEKPNDGQKRDHKRRRKMGHMVYVVSTPKEVQEYLDFTSHVYTQAVYF